MSQPFRSVKSGRWALALVAGVLLVAGLAAAPAPADPRRTPNGHIDVVEPKAPVADLSVTADGETEPVGASGDAGRRHGLLGPPFRPVAVGGHRNG